MRSSGMQLIRNYVQNPQCLHLSFGCVTAAQFVEEPPAIGKRKYQNKQNPNEESFPTAYLVGLKSEAVCFSLLNEANPH